MNEHEKQAYQDKLQAQLDEWQAEFEKYKAKADQASADARITYNESLDELKAKQEAAKKKLAELNQATENAWEDIKNTAESIFNELKEGFKSASERFK